MNHRVVGKTMENVKNRIDLKLAENDEKVRNMRTRTPLKDSKVIDLLYLID